MSIMLIAEYSRGKQTLVCYPDNAVACGFTLNLDELKVEEAATDDGFIKQLAITATQVDMEDVSLEIFGQLFGKCMTIDQHNQIYTFVARRK